ncbi:hypothetical protein ACFL4O_01665 [bacterium]
MDTLNKENNLNRSILKNIIRRLFSSFKKPPKALEELYRKVQGNYIKITENSNENEEVTIKETSKKFNCSINKTINRENITFLLKLVSVVIGAGMIFLSKLVLTRIIGAILLIIPTASLSYLKEFIFQTILKSKERKSAKEIYQKDNSIGNLEHDLNSFLSSIVKDYKIVFIIDELDKITADKDNNLSSFDIIKTYKNFFSLSKANFIFITGPEDHDQLIISDKQKKIESTLFTHRYYINFPTQNELQEYLQEIFKCIEIDGKRKKLEELGSTDKEKINDFIHYLLFKAKNDFFNLKNIIHGYSEYENNEQYLLVEAIRKEEVGINYRIKIGLQRIISMLYDIKRSNFLTNWYENSVKLSDLFNFSQDNFLKNISVDQFNDKNLICDLVECLKRFDIVVEYKDDLSKKALVWTNDIDDIPDTLDFKFPKENEFLSIFQHFIDLVNELDDMLDNYEEGNFKKYDYIEEGRDGKECTNLSSYNVYDKFIEIKQNLENIPPKHILEEDIEEAIEEISNHIENIKSKSYSMFVSFFEKIAKNNEIALNNHTIQTRSDLFSTIQPFRNLVPNYTHRIHYTDNLNKQVMILENFPCENFSTDILKMLNEQKNTLYVINIINKEDLNYKKMLSIEEEVNKKWLKKEKKQLKEIEIQNLLNIKIDDTYKIYPEAFNEIISWLASSKMSKTRIV